MSELSGEDRFCAGYLRELEQARGSGLIKELRDRREELENGETMSIERWERELEEEEYGIEV